MRYRYILDRWLTKVIVCWTLRVVRVVIDIKVFPIVIIIAVAQIRD